MEHVLHRFLRPQWVKSLRPTQFDLRNGGLTGKNGANHPIFGVVCMISPCLLSC